MRKADDERSAFFTLALVIGGDHVPIMAHNACARFNLPFGNEFCIFSVHTRTENSWIY